MPEDRDSRITTAASSHHRIGIGISMPEDRDSRIITELSPPFAIIRFNRPAERNVLSEEVRSRLDAILSALIPRHDVRALIFTGTDDVFSAGADLRELVGLTPAAARDFALRGQRLMQRIADAPQVTIAAINGYCMGGGLDLALACDLRIASPGAVFAHPGVALGLITGWGGTQRLPRLVGPARAFEIILTARRVNAQEALEMGLINQIAANPLEAACAFANGRNRGRRSRSTFAPDQRF